ncbi:MAG TPA: FGGY-family carbohydrate kinase, partial [Chloroflexota bacterium]
PGVIIDVDDPGFFHPEDMAEAIARHLQKTGQPPVTKPAALVRAILEGLALSYRLALERSERLADTRIETIHIVGGGARNGLLCRLTADACRRPVVAGPVEATAMGNILVQAMGKGQVSDLAEAHAIARQSSDLMEYEPREAGDWDDRVARLQAMRLSPLVPTLQPSGGPMPETEKRA